MPPSSKLQIRMAPFFEEATAIGANLRNKLSGASYLAEDA